MKLEHWMIVLAAIALCFFVPFSYKVSVAEQDAREDNTAKANLSAACEDALEQVTVENPDILVYSEKEKRTASIDVFYDTMNTCYGFVSESQKEMMKYYVPCIVLVDWDGYYICYTKEYTNANSEQEYKDITTGKNTWTEIYGNTYSVQYRLDNTVTVRRLTDSFKFTGNYKTAYLSCGSPSELSFCTSADTFEKERDYTVVHTIEEQTEYYINTHNTFMNRYDANYSFSMPQTDGDYEARMMTTPSVIGFFQGVQYSYGSGYINAYSLCASHVIEDETYYIQSEPDGTLYYHTKDCSKLTNRGKTGTMDECAKNGADPCPYCIH